MTCRCQQTSVALFVRFFVMWIEQMDMSMKENRFTLRAMQPSDSPELGKLITTFDGDMTTQFEVNAYEAILFGTENHTAGVVVEAAGHDGLVGLGTVRFSQVQFNNEILPLAFLDGLKVHPDFRKQGLGYQIASWRVQQAIDTYGERCVIATGLLRSNDASRATARKWCREFIDVAFQPVIQTRRSRQPRSTQGIQIRELAPNEYAQFALKQNRYYQTYNLFPPASAETIAHALDVTVADKKPYRFYAAFDAGGDMLAGTQVWCRGLLKNDIFSNPPPPLRILNPLLHILPPDFILRDAAVAGLWHEAGQSQAAQFLWEWLRWELRDAAPNIFLAIDPRDPLRAVTGRPPFFMPKIEITIALRGPTPIERDKLVFGYGRV
jgi:predicted N-acetyltransferase YhbS